MLQKVTSNGLDLNRLMVWGGCVCVCVKIHLKETIIRVHSNDELKKQSPEFGLICHVHCT